MKTSFNKYPHAFDGHSHAFSQCAAIFAGCRGVEPSGLARMLRIEANRIQKVFARGENDCFTHDTSLLPAMGQARELSVSDEMNLFQQYVSFFAHSRFVQPEEMIHVLRSEAEQIEMEELTPATC